jgi:hypothetical protein
LPRQQNLDASAQEIAGGGIVRAEPLSTLAAAMAIQAGREDPCVVQDKEVIGEEQVGEVAELPVVPGLAVSDQVQQAGTSTVGERFLRDSVRRKIIVEVGDKHEEQGLMS